MIETIEVCTTITLGIQSITSGLAHSDSAGDDVAILWLNKVLDIAEKRNLTILLYPHLDFWLETHLDAVRLCEQINHPNLGIHFSAYHWYAVTGFDFTGTIEMVAPNLKQVLLAGSTKDPNGIGGVATIEPLYDGKLDNFAILGKLKQIGFDGDIGFLNAEWGRDLYSKLARSLDLFRDMEKRLDKFPHWARLEQPY